MSAARRPKRSRAVGLVTRLLMVAGLLVLVAIMGLPGGRSSAQTAANQNTYSLTAEGDGELYKVVNAQLPASTTEEVSPYSAQAANDSSGNSTAFAGLPYLGPVAATIEGTVNGLSGGATPPIPPAPGFVTVTYPGDSTADESQGPYVVQATAAQYTSTAKAGLGISPNASSQPNATQQVFSNASVVANPDGSVTSTASAGVDALNLGVLDALNVSSTETITETGSGAPVITGSSKLGTVQILGFTVGITPNGFDLIGANLPLPTGAILAEINSVLGKDNTQIAILPGSTTKDPDTGATTVTSDSLEVTTVQNVPALGSTAITYDFGRVTVSAADVSTSGSGDSGATTPPVSSPPVTSSSSGTGLSTGTGSTSTGTGASSVAVPVSTGTSVGGTGDTGSSSGLSPSLASTAPSSAGGGLPSSTPSSGTGSSSSLPTSLGYLPVASVTGVSVHGLYLLLVLAGLGAIATATIFRQFGVRLIGL